MASSNCVMFLPSGMTAVPAAVPGVKDAHGASIFVHVFVTGKVKIGWTQVLSAMVPAQVPTASPAFAAVDGSVSCIGTFSETLGALPRTQNETPVNFVAFTQALSQMPIPPP